jgi:hypothetical protein
MQKHSRANDPTHPRSLLYDHKNKLSLPPKDLAAPDNKTKVLRAATRNTSRAHITLRNRSLRDVAPSPPRAASQSVESSVHPFSKSEEETKAEQ